MEMTMTSSMTGMTLARPRFSAASSAPIPAAVWSMTTGWPVTPAVPATSYQHDSADLRPVSHNSIARTDVVLPAVAGRGGFGAKQAAPPRGVPR